MLTEIDSDQGSSLNERVLFIVAHSGGRRIREAEPRCPAAELRDLPKRCFAYRQHTKSAQSCRSTFPKSVM